MCYVGGGAEKLLANTRIYPKMFYYNFLVYIKWLEIKIDPKYMAEDGLISISSLQSQIILLN